MIARILRGAAVLMVIAGVIDPAISIARRARPIVAVVGANPATTTAASDAVTRAEAHVTDALSRTFDVVRTPDPRATAIVVVAEEMPEHVDPGTAPAFVVTPALSRIRIDDVDAPGHVSPDSRVPITVSVQATGATGEHLQLALLADGIVVDRAAHVVTGADDRFASTLTLPSSNTGPMRVRVEVRDTATRAVEAVADDGIDVRAAPWSVLVFDARPSWTSTFVRRVLEADRRFRVVTRIETSQGVATAVAGAPAALSDAAALSPFDAVLVGAPEALTDADVGGLERFARERGGSVVLLFDRREAGPIDRLLAIDRWRESDSPNPLKINPVSGVSGGLLASQFAVPDELPAGSTTLATVTLGGQTRPAVWRTPLGAGAIIATGALDAWRNRGAADQGFAAFWQGVVASAADQAPQLIEVHAHNTLAEIGESVDVDVVVRPSPAISAGVQTIAARVDGPAGTTPLRLWPDAMAGRYRGTFDATVPGLHHLVVTSAGVTGTVPVLVGDRIARAARDQSAALEGWAHAHGGRLFSERDGAVLVAALESATSPKMTRDVVHPWRSPWWIAPIVFCLGTEWWWRRRRGLA